MNIDTSTIVLYVGTKVLPALWSVIVTHTQTQAQTIERYCPPAVELPANMTDFQKQQYEKQCGNLNVYTIKVKPVQKPEADLIGPPEPVHAGN